MENLIDIKPITETKFVGEILGEALDKGIHVKSSSVPQTVKGTFDGINFVTAMENVEYLRDLIGEIERRKLLAVMSMTPVKIMACSASALGFVIKNLSNVSDELSQKLRIVEHRLGEKSNNASKISLSENDKKRIDKFLNKQG